MLMNFGAKWEQGFQHSYVAYLPTMDPVNRNMLPSMPLITTPFKPDLSESSMLALGRLSPLPLCSSSGFNVQSIVTDLPDVSTAASSNVAHNISFCKSSNYEIARSSDDFDIESTSNIHLHREVSSPPPRLLFENNSFVTISSKKASPMKIVSPILKKYNSHRTGKNNKKSVSPKPTTVLDGSAPLINSPTPGCSKSPDFAFVENHILENEELPAKSTASPRCPKRKQAPAVNKKKKKQELKEVQTMLSLLDPDTEASKEEDSLKYAQAFYFFMKDCLETDDNGYLLDEILKVLAEFNVHTMPVAEFYNRVISLLANYPILAEQFLILLLPEQALECGKFIEHLRLTNMHTFVKKLKIFFAKQPQQLRIVFSMLEALSRNENVTTSTVKSLVVPLLKGNTFLIDSFLSLLPDERPPDSWMDEFEDMEVDSDHSGNEEEVVDIPEEMDPYGTDHCLCHCHNSNDEKYTGRHQHCVSCGTKFIHGKVYLQTGRSLRPAKIAFPGLPNQDHRIYVEIDQKERRRRNTNSPVKGAQTSPNCDDSISEIEEDPKFLSPKSSRTKTKITNSASKVRASIMKCAPDNASSEPEVFKTAPSTSSEQSLLLSDLSLDEDTLELASLFPFISPQHNTSTTLLSLDSNITLIHLAETDNNAPHCTPKINYEDISNLEVFIDETPIESHDCVNVLTSCSDISINCSEGKSAVCLDSTNLEWPVSVKEDCLSQDCTLVLEVKGECETTIEKTEPPLIEEPSRSVSPSNTFEVPSAALVDHFTEPEPVGGGVSTTLLDRLTETSSQGDADGTKEDLGSLSSKTKRARPPWTKDEDKVILLEVQRGYSVDKTFQNIRGLPQRSLEEIRERFHTLMKMLQEMPLPKEEESSNSSSSTV